jgi:hypothetical protein
MLRLRRFYFTRQPCRNWRYMCWILIAKSMRIRKGPLAAPSRYRYSIVAGFWAWRTRCRMCVCAYLCLFHSSLPLISSTYLHPLPSLPPSLPPFLPPSLPTYLPPSLPSLPPSLPTSLPPSIPSPSLPPSLPPSIPPSIPPSFPPSLPRAGRPMVTRCCESCVSSRAGSGTAQDLPALCLRPLRLSYNLRLYLRMSIQSMNLCNVSLSLCLSLSRALSLALSLCLDRLFSGAPFTKKLECVLPSNHSVVCWDRIL